MIRRLGSGYNRGVQPVAAASSMAGARQGSSWDAGLEPSNKARSDWMHQYAAEFQLAPLEQDTDDFKPGTPRRAPH